MSADRIARLRLCALNSPAPALVSDEMRLLYARGWRENAHIWLLSRRQTLARARVLCGMTPVIGEGELIVGRQNFDVALSDDERAFVNTAEAFIPARAGQDSHMALDYEKLLKLGTRGVKEEIEGCLSALSSKADSETLEKRVFYENCIIMLNALETLAGNYAACARDEARKKEASDPCRARELYDIAQMLENVPMSPACTFHEALQSVQMLTFHLGGLYQAGRPDQYLLKFYEADARAGRLDEARALELINCFCIMYTRTVPKSLAVGFMVGGRDKYGNCVDNALTRLFLKSIRFTRLAYPGIGLCITPQTSDEVLRLAAEALGEGLTHPALFNDDVIVNGLTRLGVKFEDAVCYVHSTCVEITPVGCSGVWVASPYHNLVEPLNQIIAERAHDLSITFDSLIEEYKARLAREVRKASDEQNLMLMNRAHTYTNPLVSCFVSDCIARGRDVDAGGARYAYRTPSFVGMANLVDALAAIKTLVFERKEYTLCDIARALKADFAGYEKLRAHISARAPRYGNDEREADALANMVARFLPETLKELKTYMGHPLAPSMFCWVMHDILGRETGASADGRGAGFPLGDGSGPAQGRERRGPTASILSSTSWDHTPFVGGVAVNMKFSKALFGGAALEKLISMIRVFIERGGFEMQINVVDAQTLIDARAHPENYKDLVVRIGGYSDYFTSLSSGMQDEVILRTAHEA